MDYKVSMIQLAFTEVGSLLGGTQKKVMDMCSADFWTSGPENWFSSLKISP